MADLRQRFYFDQAPIRGEIVQLTDSVEKILSQRDYPPALKSILSEMLVASALLASTLKIQGRISVQLQSEGPLKWAMAECTHQGELRGLCQFEPDARFEQADYALFAELRQNKGTLFINIEPEQGNRYQGVISLDADDLAGSLSDYYQMSVQIPTQLSLCHDGNSAAGLLVQLMPASDQDEHSDQDAWTRAKILASTIKPNELLTLEPEEILHRLYHEEVIKVAPLEQLRFGCTCSKQRCEAALSQIGRDAVLQLLTEVEVIEMDCNFCGQMYRFDHDQALSLFVS